MHCLGKDLASCWVHIHGPWFQRWCASKCELLSVATHLSDSQQKIYLHADLTSADLKQGTMVLDWSIIFDTCDSLSMHCTSINIYFDAWVLCFLSLRLCPFIPYSNLLQHSDTNNSEPSDNNRPTVPTFIWNGTADDQDYYLSNSPKFQTELSVFPQHKYGVIHEVRHTYSSDVYYPFDRWWHSHLCDRIITHTTKQLLCWGTGLCRRC